MLPSERQGSILERVNDAGYAKTTDLQEVFGVSHMTVQRDLRDLEHRGLLRRVRGGAAALGTHDVGYGLRERLNRLEKEAIGRAAAALVENGQSVFIDAGTTALEVARHLAKAFASTLNLVTTSVKVSAELAASAQPARQTAGRRRLRPVVRRRRTRNGCSTQPPLLGLGLFRNGGSECGDRNDKQQPHRGEC